MTSPPRSRTRPTVVLVSGPGTLGTVDPVLRRHGVRPVRLTAIEPRPIGPEHWMERVLRWPTPDTVVVTSRAAVAAGICPWRRVLGELPPKVEFWAVGPGTASALREAGVRRVRRPNTAGASALAEVLGSAPTRRVLYFRSERAGPALARSLRRQGHQVLDPVVYRLQSPSSFPTRNRQELARADLLVVTSPSGFTELKRRLDRATFSHLTNNVPTIVLGGRSLRRAREYGFRRASVSPSTGAQRFTHHLLAELRHAHA